MATGFEVREQRYDRRGFWIEFENGYRVSVQFGFGNYCENRDGQSFYSADAEIAAWDTNNHNKWYAHPEWGDDVKGYCTPAEVLDFMNEVAALPRTRR